MFWAVEKLEKLLADLRLAIYRETFPITCWKTSACDVAGAHRVDVDDAGWSEFRLGDAWGGYDEVAWFRTTVAVPEHLRAEKLALHLRVGPRDGGNSTAEALLYVNGAPLQGVDVYHPEACLPPETVAAGVLHVAIRAWSGVLEVPPHRHFRVAELVWIDQPAERLYYLASTLLGAARQIDPDDLRHVELLKLVDAALRCVDWPGYERRAFYGSIAEAEGWLRAGLERLRRAGELVPAVRAVGHSHIDLAWLWRMRHAREKAGRTFSTVMNLMRQYPDYCFAQSSAQLYQWVAQDYPELFARIKTEVAAGRWEVTGGMWVEADCNLPGGEALVRQILYGKRYFQREFGVDTEVLWLPDVFGFPWSLPQLMLKSGLRYFVTSKLSWNQFNRFPYDTFRWRGIDGSEVLAHCITTPEKSDGSWQHTYNGLLTPFDVSGLWRHYRQKHLNDELLMLYGWGDGGGGPTKEMLESAAVLRHVPGMPRVELGPAQPFFDRLSDRVAGQPVPTWDGELYLELHRGTYTSQAASKRANRKAELLYHTAEWLGALRDLLLDVDDYPLAELRAGWELLLLNQFHDILPGSSIREVYQDSHAQYAEIMRIGERAASSARDAIVAALDTVDPALVVFNDLAWSRSGVVALPDDPALAGRALQLPDGRVTPLQITECDGARHVLAAVGAVPALGYRAFPLVPDAGVAESEPLVVLPDRLENRFFRIALSRSGQLTSIWDKEHAREVLAPGGLGNVLQVFTDKPINFDAWDIDIYYGESQRVIDELVEAVVEERGPLRGVLRLQWRWGPSTITQRITLYPDSRRIDFRTECDWQARQQLLKVAFAVAVRSARATYAIQWGSIERPTHWNTSWDWAQFESVAHQWVDLSEGGYGVALLNDCKYGHDVKDNVLRLTLIKSPILPDPTADQGRHVFTYSLLPHAGDWRAGAVVQAAADLNSPLDGVATAAHPGALPPAFAAVEVAPAHVIVETVKRAEDDAAWIVRVYEYQQIRSAQVTLRFGRPIVAAAECDLLENSIAPVAFDSQHIMFAVAPYEIKTLKVWFAPS